MFAFQGGESADTVSRKKGYMKDAQQRWKFLTNFDLSSIRSKGQLSSMVKDRLGISEAQAQSGVQAWMEGKDFEQGPCTGRPGQLSLNRSRCARSGGS